MSNVPNLDSMSEEELRTFWYKYHQPTVKSVKGLFGYTNDANYIRTSEKLANYAINKSAAKHCRKEGNITGAEIYEKACGMIYDDLPSYAKW